MSNSTVTFDALVQSQASKEITANAFFDAASPAAAFGRRQSTTTGLTWGYYGFTYTHPQTGVLTQEANGTVLLLASKTQHVEAGFVSTTTNPIISISLASPCVIGCTAHPFGIGDVLWIDSIVGTTQLNKTFARVTAIAANTVTLDISTASGFTAWSSGGTLSRVTTVGTIAMKVGKGLGPIASPAFVAPIPSYQCVVGASTVTTYTDYRIGALPDVPGKLIKAMADANQVLSQAEVQNAIIELTGTNTALRNLIVPPIARQWTIFANTATNGVQVIGPTGTGITVGVGKRAIVYHDGTNVVRVTADL
jgi:hypothetical protein